LKRFSILTSNARRRAHAPQGFFEGDLDLSPIVSFALNLAALLFIGAVTVAVFIAGFSLY